MLNDIRIALRTLLKAPAFTAVAVLVLALGIGANSAVFSLVNALLIKPTAGDLATTPVVGLYSQDRTKPDSYRDFSYRDFEELRAHNPVFSEMTALTLSMAGYTEGDQTRTMFAAIVSSNYFSMYGTGMAAGRAFTAGEEKPGADTPVVIVNYEHWRKRGFDRSLVGRVIRINAKPFTVVGVAPKGFSIASSMFSPEFWVPTGAYELVVNDAFLQKDHPTLADPMNRALMLSGRLKPGLTVEATVPLLRTLSAQREQASSAENRNQVLLTHALTRFSVSTNPQDDRQMGQLSVLLLAMTGIVLLIACLNLANMLLARATTRKKEVAIRLALGSGRFPIVRQLLVEGLLLSVAGGALGLLIAYWATRMLVASIGPAMRDLLIFNIDPRPDTLVLLATLGFCALATLVFALGPAWKLSRTDVVPELKEQGGETGRKSRVRFGLRNALVVGQVALSLALLTAAGLFMHAAVKAAAADPGFGVEGLLLVNVDPGMAGYNETQGRETYRRLMERMRSLPGVQSASLASVVPFGDYTEGRTVLKVGADEAKSAGGTGDADASVSMGSGGTPRDRGNGIGANFYIVGADYFRALGIRVLRGRGFTAAEEQSSVSPRCAVVDETLAKKLFPKGDPLGQYIRFTGTGTSTTPAMEVVGVVAPIRHSLLETTQQPQVYVPFGQLYRANIHLHLKVRPGTEPSMLATVRREVRGVDERVPVLALRTFRDHRDASVSLWAVRTAASLFTAFGAAAVFLALVGVYGVKAYLVSRRTREIGIRMSLGATPHDVLWLVLREGLAMTLVGVVIGLGLAGLIGMAVKGMLYEVSPLDPVTFATAPALLALATLLACYIPARRAMKVAPIKALRFE
jgi:predicted permease